MLDHCAGLLNSENILSNIGITVFVDMSKDFDNVVSRVLICDEQDILTIWEIAKVSA